VKHGLTRDEAKEYTAFGGKFDMGRHFSSEEKAMLENNLRVQIYAFRKIKEKLLCHDNVAGLYD